MRGSIVRLLVHPFVCLFVPLVCFLPKCYCISESVCLFVSLAATLLHSLYFPSVVTVIVSFDFVTQLLFSSITTHQFLFHFLICYWWRIKDIAFKWHGLCLPVHCMGKLFKVSTFVSVCFLRRR